jgi:AAA domain
MKSTSMGMVVDELLLDPKRQADEVPIVLVTLDGGTKNTKLLHAQILAAYDDPGAEELRTARDYSEADVNCVLRGLASTYKTSVLVLDEAHNMLGNDSTSATTRNMRQAMKSLVNGGVFSLILMGTDEARVLFDAEETLARVKPPIDLGRFDVRRDEDREYFRGFVGLFEEAMLAKRVIDEPIGLVEDYKACALTYDIADGIAGRVPRILRVCVDAGYNIIDWEIIEAEFRAWRAIQSEQALKRAYDPFARGARTNTLQQTEKDYPKRREMGRHKPKGGKAPGPDDDDYDEMDEAA